LLFFFKNFSRGVKNGVFHRKIARKPRLRPPLLHAKARKSWPPLPRRCSRSARPRPISLPDVATGRTVSSADFSGEKNLLVIFLCAHCPFVHHVKNELAHIGRDYAGKSLAIVAITSNDTGSHPQDAPEPTAKFAREAGFTFPVLFDATQAVAKKFTAACTPDFFLYDQNRKLAYRGQLDDSRPGKGTADGRDLRAAIDALLAGRAVDAKQKPSIGCNIKWRPGNEPEYFLH
jgi:peroxiredoxin